MSQFSTEHALWDLSGNPVNIQQYMADPDAFLDRYNLSDEERKMIREKDVKGLAKQGNSQMLIMLFYLAQEGGFEHLPDYLGKMNAA